MKKLLTLLSSFALATFSTSSITSCSIAFVYHRDDNPSDDNDLDDEIAIEISLAEIKAKTTDIVDMLSVEEVNNELSQLKIRGVKSLIAQLIEGETRSVLVSVQLQLGFVLTDDTNEFIIKNALVEQNFVYTSDIQETAATLRQTTSLLAFQRNLDSLQIEGVSKLVAEYCVDSDEDIWVFIELEQGYTLIGEESFVIESAIMREVEPSLDGTLEYFQTLMYDAKSWYLKYSENTVNTTFMQYIRQHANKDRIAIIGSLNSSTPASPLQILITSTSSNKTVPNEVTLSIGYRRPLENEDGNLVWNTEIEQMTIIIPLN